MSDHESLAESQPPEVPYVTPPEVLAAARWWDRLYLWTEIANDELDDIRSWRDHLDRRAPYDWPQSPIKSGMHHIDECFVSLTRSVVSRLATDYPNLDSSPLHKICEWVEAWYSERSADSLPPQAKIDRTFSLALNMLAGPRAQAWNGMRQTTPLAMAVWQPPADAETRQANPLAHHEQGGLIVPTQPIAEKLTERERAKSGKCDTIDVRMKDILDKDPEAYLWSIPKWLVRLGTRSRSGVQATPAWNRIMTLRKMKELERWEKLDAESLNPKRTNGRRKRTHRSEY